MLTLARQPPQPRCHVASASPSPNHINKGSQTLGLSRLNASLTNMFSAYGSTPSQYDTYGNRRKYR